VGAAVGGTIGGTALAAAALAGLLLWRRKQKQKQEDSKVAVESSFKLLDTSMKRSGNTAGTTPISALFPQRDEVEMPSNIAQPRGTSELDISPAQAVLSYQPYRPAHTSSVATASVNSLNRQSVSPELSAQHSYHYPSYASLGAMPAVPEVHGDSADNSRATTPTRWNRGESRFTELDVPHMRTQSGPVPEWKHEMS